MDGTDFQPANVHSKRQRLEDVPEPSMHIEEDIPVELQASMSSQMVDSATAQETAAVGVQEENDNQAAIVPGNGKGKGKEAEFIPVHGKAVYLISDVIETVETYRCLICIHRQLQGVLRKEETRS